MKTLFVGDVSPTKDTYALYAAGETDRLFGDTKELFVGNDINMVNLECAITDAEEGIKKMPRLFTQGRTRVAPYAYLILPTATPNQYLTGLRHMQVTIDYLRQRGPQALGRLTLAEQENVRTLRRLVDEGIQPTTQRLMELIG